MITSDELKNLIAKKLYYDLIKIITEITEQLKIRMNALSALIDAENTDLICFTLRIFIENSNLPENMRMDALNASIAQYNPWSFNLIISHPHTPEAIR